MSHRARLGPEDGIIRKRRLDVTGGWCSGRKIRIEWATVTRSNPADPAAMEALKAESTIPQRVALRQCKYLNNVIEQDHRTVKKHVWLAKGYGSSQSAWRTLQGIKAVNMIRKGRVKWLTKGNGVGQSIFIGALFGIVAA